MKDEFDAWPDVVWPGGDRPDFQELTVFLGEGLEPTRTAISKGHADLVWEADGDGVVTIADAKRTRFTAELDSLQLDAYGWAYAAEVGAKGYMAGLYIIEDGEWIWRNSPVYLHSLEGADIAERLLHAIHNEETVIGPHCAQCYECQHCPEYMLPAIRAMTLTDGIDALYNEINPENAAEILRLKDAAKRLMEVADTRIKAYVHEHGHIKETRTDKKGKAVEWEWGPIGGGKPTATFDVKRFREENPALVEAYMRPGTTRAQNRWAKVK
jgi:hypothetical protein